MKARHVAAALVILAAAPAHADIYSRYYQPAPRGSVALLPSSEPPELIASSGDANTDLLKMWQKGYAPLGYSLFNAELRDPSKALKFARKLKARFVIAFRGEVSERSGSIPWTTPTTNMTQTFGNMNMTNPYGGSASGTFNATTMSNGTRTTYIPFTMRRADQAAAYFAPAERKGSGIYGRPLNDEERATLGTNRGMRVLAVRDDSPAYLADIVPGDIVMAVNGTPWDRETWGTIMLAPAGSTIRLTVRRNDLAKDVPVSIPQGWN